MDDALKALYRELHTLVSDLVEDGVLDGALNRDEIVKVLVAIAALDYEP